MNEQEFFQFLIDAGADLLNPPLHPFRDMWKQISDAIKPHFYGTVPCALDEAFPNEEGQILAYRKKTYQSKTESPIVKAITELSRMLSSAKHSIKFDNTQMNEYYKTKKFDGYSILRYFFSVFTQNRILDANAVLLVVPTGDGLHDDSIKIDIEFQLIPSSSILFKDNEYKLLIFKSKPKNKYQSKKIINKEIYNIVTDKFFGSVYKVDDEYQFIVNYTQSESKMPWVDLGGRSVPFCDENGSIFQVYKSDFSPAIPYLNDAAIFDNQFKSVALSCGFPAKFIEGINCNTCHGTGNIYDELEPLGKKCTSCKGSGKTISISPLAGYYINPVNNKLVDQQPMPDPIRYFSPDTAIITLTKTNADTSLEKAEQVLNINRSLKQAQSGTAKELDREPEYIEVGRISDDVYYKFGEILEIIQGLRFMDYKSAVTVTAPISFDLKTETELLLEFKSSQMGMPAAIRFEAYISFMDRRFASNPVSRQIAEICAHYTSIYLYTIEETNIGLANGSIMLEDAIKARYAFDATLDLYYAQKIDIFNSDFNVIRDGLDAILAPKLDAAKSVELPDMGGFDDQPDDKETEI